MLQGFLKQLKKFLGKLQPKVVYTKTLKNLHFCFSFFRRRVLVHEPEPGINSLVPSIIVVLILRNVSCSILSKLS